MVGFPKVPLVNGDTDDDASIHLHAQVGPAKPLPSKKSSKDEEILRILKETDNENNDANEFNKYFRIFQKTGKIIEYTSNGEEEDIEIDGYEEPETEDEYEDDHFSETHEQGDEEKDEENIYAGLYNEEETETNKPNQTLFEEFKKAKDDTDTFIGRTTTKSDNNYKKYGVLGIISFLVTLIVALYYQNDFNSTSIPISKLPSSIDNYSQINSKFVSIEKNFNKLNDFTNNLSRRQDFIEKSYDSLSNSLNSKFDLISNKFHEINLKLDDNKQVKNLYDEFNNLKNQIERQQIGLNPEPKLTEINEKLNKLAQISDNIESIKTDILNDLINSLPNHIPIYIKNKKIHYVPEFHKYLYNFIENYNREKNYTLSWDKFIAENEPNLNNYLNSILNKNSSNLKFLNKDAFERMMNKRFNENNKLIWVKFNNLIDNLNLVNPNSTTELKFNKSTNKILLNNLLDIFAKGSIKINYADYNLGARILGFLTTSGKPSDKSVLRRLFLGWYDYLNANGISSPKNWKFNANNVLIDNSNNWECESNKCSIGIRLFNPIILTDLILKNPTGSSIQNPSFLSIYVKPKNFNHFNSLIKYLNQIKFNFISNSENKYLKKFIKIKEISLDPSKTINHIKLPVTLINLRIPIKDLYIEFSSSNGITGLNNLKAYGISEFNAYKYNEEFNLLLDKIYDENEELTKSKSDEFEHTDYNQYNENNEFDDGVLGDDEILF